MKIRLRVGMTLGPAGSVVDVADATAARLIRRNAADIAPEPAVEPKKKASKPKEE